MDPGWQIDLNPHTALVNSGNYGPATGEGLPHDFLCVNLSSHRIGRE